MRFLTMGVVLALGLALGSGGGAEGAEAGESLLRLVPADVAVTLAVEGLRDHARDYFASPLAAELGRLPAVRSWFESDRFHRFVEARRQLERLLGGDAAVLRDDLLGDAVVLALHLPPEGRQDDARGLLLLRARDRAVLDRLIEGVNEAQKRRGELLEVEARAHGDVAYWVRRFGPASQRPTEYYTVVDGQVFAWSNSERLVQGVIDRQAGRQPGLGDDAAFQRIRKALPERAVASLYANPRFLGALVSNAPAATRSKPADEQVLALLRQYLSALDYVGAAVEWRGATGAGRAGLIVHTEESIDPDRFAPWLKRWAAGPAIEPRLERIPATALAVASVHVDFQALESVVRSLVPVTDQKRLDNLEIVLTGLLRGRDVKTEVLARIGPAVLAYLELPDRRVSPGRFSLVAEVDLGREPGVEAAVATALRTVLAAYALDPKHDGGDLTIQSQPIAGTVVTALAPASPFAFAVHQGWLVIGRRAALVARALDPAVASPRRFEPIRAAYFPETASFVCIDLKALHRFADSHRDGLAARIAARQGRSRDGARRDLDQALALIGLFGDAFLTSRLAADARSVHRTLGLITRGSEPETSRP